MDGKEKSQTLYEELKRLEATFPAIEAAEMAVLDDPENRDLFVRCQLAAHLFLNDPRTKAFQVSFDELKRSVARPRLAYNETHNRLVNEFRIVTGPFIERSIKTLERLLLDIPPLDEGKVFEESGGFSMMSMVVLNSNRSAILETRKIISKGVESLRTMTVRPISEIEAFTEEQIRRIQGISFAPVEIKLSRDDYGRRLFLEQGVLR